MLTKNLQAIYESLNNQKTGLTKDQKILLQELKFLDENETIGNQLKNFSYVATALESFSAAKGSCPICGKKY